jgi:hypothetical protein
MNDVPVSFTHILNPFSTKVGSPHEAANRVTWQTLRVAHSQARAHGLSVECKSVIFPEDEAAVDAPTTTIAYLNRSVQDIKQLSPHRAFPLIADLLSIGAADETSTHIIFSNMDIAVQPHFYLALRDLYSGPLEREVPFTVPRLNIDEKLVNGTLEQMYQASGPIGVGFDCFVLPRELVSKLDLGACCIGAPHFDQLLLIELDVLSGHKAKRLYDQRLTFHFGNDIAWTTMMDYIEFNLAESLAAIDRIKRKHLIEPASVFAEVDRRHFQRNAMPSSVLFRRLRRVPGLSSLILTLKRIIGRQY